MNFNTCYQNSKYLLMEGALGERLKREYHLNFDGPVAMADLVYDRAGKDALTALWKEYIEIAERYHLPFLATTPTRRANMERVTNAGYQSSIIRDNVELLKDIREKNYAGTMFIGGLMGCKGDAYKATEVLSVTEAKQFHLWQADLLLQAGADFLYAGIMPALSEAIGMAQAMEATGVPYIISFMIRKNGRLIDGTTIGDAIKTIDANVNRKPVCYMTNCVHPSVVTEALNYEFNQTPEVRTRFQGIQANTSPLSPEELDHAKELMCSDPVALASKISELKELYDFKIYGGCCGTDGSHMEEIAKMLISIPI